MLFKTLSLMLLATISAEMVSAGSVVAHFMMDNSYAYDVDQWKTDMKSAKQIGIDGFALNWIPPDCSDGRSWQVDRIDDAYAAAEQTGFQLMFSFDMSYSVCDTFWNTTFMSTMISKYAGSSAAMRWNTNLLVSTYGGDTVDEYGNTFFQDLKNAMNYAGHAIALTPALTSYSQAAQYTPAISAASLVAEYPAIDGYFNWQAWPLVNDNLTVSADVAFKSAMKLAGKTGPYMMAISPWQFKDLNDGVSANSWVSYSDTLFAQRLHAVANSAFAPDIIEILTWNDFCESHYLRDIPSTDESATDYVTYSNGMENYVLGMNHAPWRIIAKYYIDWWKNGVAPAITMDQVVYWYRIHPKAAVCTGGAATGSVRNYEYPEDAVFAWALVKEEATISISVGSNAYWTFIADGSGPTTGMVPFPSDLGYDGVTPSVAIVRDGKTVQISNGSIPITEDCAWQNFNPVVNLAGEGINQ